MWMNVHEFTGLRKKPEFRNGARIVPGAAIHVHHFPKRPVNQVQRRLRYRGPIIRRRLLLTTTGGAAVTVPVLLRHSLDLGRVERLAAGNVGRVVGEIELGGAAAEAEQGGVESARRLLRRVVGAEPYAFPAVGEAYLGDVFPPFPLAHAPVLELVSHRRRGKELVCKSGENGLFSV